MSGMGGAVAAPLVREESATRSSVRVPRAIALTVDLVLIAAIMFPLGSVFGVSRVTSGIPATGLGGTSFITTTTVLDWPWQLAVSLGYFAMFELLFRATPGKLLCGLRVVAVDGSAAPISAVVVRNLLRVIDALPTLYLAGGLLVLFSRRHQRLGDMAGQTCVAARGAAPDGGRISKRQRMRGLALLGALAAGLIAYSLAFDYFGRPPLVLESMGNTGELNFINHGQAYTLGRPAVNGAEATVPVRFVREDGVICQGHLTLEWAGFLSGWRMGSAGTHCP